MNLQQFSIGTLVHARNRLVAGLGRTITSLGPHEEVVIRQLLSSRTPSSSKSLLAARKAHVLTEQQQQQQQQQMQTAPQHDPLTGKFMIPAKEVKRLMSTSGMSIEEFLMSLIQPASRLARSPVSGYRVGAAGLSASGAVYVGVNLEFPGAPLNNSVHAEQFLVVNCLHHGEESLSMLAVSAAPCGHCRQFYAELYKSDAVTFLFGEDCHPRSLDELLPLRFGPHDLIADEPFPLLLQPHDNSVTYTKAALKVLAERAADEPFQEAARDALQEAVKAYSPYTHCPSGAALITQDGRVFSGGSIESAAYNPSLSPFHAAYIDAVTGDMARFDEIKEVVLAEVKGARVKHKHNINLLLKSVAPKASLTVLPLEWSK